jgi:S-DNA-T family DNA segregation ATPase FtsK/SpoIIIE
MQLTPQMLKLVPNLKNYPPEIQKEVLKLSMKMTSLGFMAVFQNAEEGPIVRTYFFEPFADISLAKILSKEEDLALSLGVESLLITRSLGYISIAVPRNDREIIQFDKCLYELASSVETKQMTLPLLMGKNTRGESLYLDLATQPHLLIAGATGAGKSIFTSQLILSLSLLRSPDDLEFILADTKQLDLVLFETLPHVSSVLRTISDIRMSLEALLSEVRDRTEKMSGTCRNVAEWNEVRPQEKFKYKILIIDEFADVVDADRALLSDIEKKYRPESVESLVKRLAQISRAVGVHIIIATQRPSVKVISGDIKANFPARIAFKLATMMDSRVILDENGAEKLLGKGDYLYKTATSDQIHRAHSAYVSMKDITNMISQHSMLRQQFGGLNG